MELDGNLREMAQEMQDTDLIGKLSGGDLVAIEAKYHLHCLVGFRNRYRSSTQQHESQKSREMCRTIEARCFAELATYITNNLDEGHSMFKLQDLYTLYVDRRRTFGLEMEINKTVLKEKLLKHFGSHCQEQSMGRSKLLVFSDGMKEILKEMTDRPDKDALAMAQITNKIRKDIFELPPYTFTGSYFDSLNNAFYLYKTNTFNNDFIQTLHQDHGCHNVDVCRAKTKSLLVWVG